MTTVPRLPDPLTEEGLRNLMREEPYWNLNHPRSTLYRRLVEKGFALLYPGPGKLDAIGRMIRPDPLPPHQVAPLVAEVNREMDRLERMLEGDASPAHDGGFDERSRGGGENAVHVQSHARDGGRTEVTDYWRARPGQGTGTDASNSSGNADDAEDVQAGTDDSKPWKDRPNAELREAIAEYEQSANKSNDGYEEYHPKGALGRYQMTPGALQDIKWRNPDGTWTEDAREHGVASDADFLENPEAQETAMDKLLDRYEVEANEKRLFGRVGQKIEGRVAEIEVTKAGVMAAVHRGGATGTDEYFKKIDQAGGVSKDASLDETELAIETRMRKSQGIDYQRSKDR